MTPHLDAATIDAAADWRRAMDAIVAGHSLAVPDVDDVLLRRGADSLLSRCAMIDGVGALVKTATVFPGNAAQGIPTIGGSVALFADDTGALDATLDFGALTRWKTAADSALAASRLARSDSASILVVGAGSVAESMIDAYATVFPDASYSVWNRSTRRAVELCERTGAEHATDLEPAVRGADIICTATMSSTPVLVGDWLRPGQHVDLIGGFRADMREADDACIALSRVFADCRITAADVGDIADPIRSGLLVLGDVADFSGLSDGTFARTSPDQITLCKNAGGAHLDLMVARYLLDAAIG